MRITGCIWVAALLLAAGCAGSRSRPQPREVSLAEFNRSDGEPAEPGEAAEDAPAGIPDAAAEAPGEAETFVEDEGDVILDFPDDEPTVGPGETIIIDSLVGQVNGRPVYAHDFFEPIGDELRALAERSSTAREFRAVATDVIRARLSQVVLDELFLAEAESQLTPEQRQGLLYFMNALREGVIGREGGGTRAQAEQTLRDQEGIGVEEYVELRKDQELLRNLFQQQIESRVIVSWRDIEREYTRRIGEFQPPPTARLSRIRLSTTQAAEQIAEVGRRLAAGEPFGQIADGVGMPDEGSWEQFELGPGGLGEIDLREEIRSQIAHLQPGQTSEAFAVGRSTWWLHLDEIDQPEGRSIYDPDVQRLLTAQIMGRRRIEEQNRYIATLLAEGIYDELQEMGDRLLQVAVDRYAR